MMSDAEFLTEIQKRVKESAERLSAADKELTIREKEYEYYDKLVRSLKRVVAHEEWISQQQKTIEA